MGTRLLLLIAALTVATGARADNCHLLADIVEKEITAYVLDIPRQPMDEQFTAQVCGATARTVSKAYTRALANANIHVSWSNSTIRNGDYCLSHDLDQCYPHRNPYMPPTFAGDTFLVVDSWRALQNVMRQSVSGKLNPDTSHFISGRLRNGLRQELRMTAPGHLSLFQRQPGR